MTAEAEKIVEAFTLRHPEFAEKYKFDADSQRYFDKDGSPLNLFHWTALFNDRGYRVVALDETEHASVSTVWLGLDHRYGDGPPLIFETMVFMKPRELGVEGNIQWRYSTLEEALAGHAEALRKTKENILNVMDEDGFHES